MVFKVKQNTGAQSEIFQGREGFVESGHFNKHFVKNVRYKILDTLKTTFWLENLIQSHNQGIFFLNHCLPPVAR